MATLTIQVPGLAPVSHLLRDDTITIGRMKGNSIVIEDDSISLMHARITRKGGEFYLKDLNSTNGTRVNGQPISEARLQDMDRVRFAEIAGQFEAAAANPQHSISGPAGPRRSDADLGTRRISKPSAEAPIFNSWRRSPILKLSLAAVAALALVSVIGWKYILVTRARSNPNASTPAGTAQVTLPGGALFSNGAEPGLATRTAGLNVEQLVKGLQDPDASQRRQSAAALHARGTEVKDALPALHQALNDSDPDVQMWSALTLVNNQSYDPATIPILLRLLRQENPTLRQVACLSLGLIPYQPADKDKVATALAQAAGTDADETVRKAALSSLSLIAPEVVRAPEPR